MKKIVASLVVVIIFCCSISLPTFAANTTTLEELVNSQHLTPIKSGSSELDNEVDKVLASIINENMTQYEKLLAIYNYCVLGFTYDNNNTKISLDAVDAVAIEGKPIFDPITNYEALTVLKNKIGVCDHYSAAFTALANAVGFETYALRGGLGGRTTGHSWSVIKMGKTYYIFDPQAEQYNMRNNKVRYINFGKSVLYSSRYAGFVESLEMAEKRRAEIFS